jgi:myo-inositol-1(or 4)-monophosphatase
VQDSLEQYLEIGLKAVAQGGEVLRKHWGKLERINHKKATIDLVTEADKDSETAILKILRETFPDHSILGEETGLHGDQKNGYQWIVDPLDGTTNYTHQYPIVSISLALWHREQPLIGIVYNPIFEELFQAVQGKGAFLNGSSIHVSSISTLDKSLLATGFPYDRRENPDNNYKEFCQLSQLCQGVRRGGSAALDLAYVACGRLDAYWERGIKPWDVAAGILLVKEAGGIVSNYEKAPYVFSKEKILASNGFLHDSISYSLIGLVG